MSKERNIEVENFDKIINQKCVYHDSIFLLNCDHGKKVMNFDELMKFSRYFEKYRLIPPDFDLHEFDKNNKYIYTKKDYDVMVHFHFRAEDIYLHKDVCSKEFLKSLDRLKTIKQIPLKLCLSCNKKLHSNSYSISFGIKITKYIHIHAECLLKPLSEVEI